MNFEVVTRTLPKLVGSKAAFAIQARSPEILIATGVTGMVVTTVIACRATLKAPALLEEHKQQIAIIDKATEKGVYCGNERQKDLVVAYRNTAIKFAQLYGPPVAMGVASIYCITSGKNILQQRNLALAAAYKLLDDNFKRYRNRVIESYGKDIDYMFKHDLRAEEYVEEIEENGKKKVVKKQVLVSGGHSGYERIFDETSTEWKEDAAYNHLFLWNTQRFLTDLLQVRGHLFLNEAHDALGMERTSAGAIVGWVMDRGGDDYVDFGIFDENRMIKNAAFFNGQERSIILDFNVDGPIYETFKK